jgi:hypothetical protein
MAFILIVTASPVALARGAAARDCPPCPESARALRREAIDAALERAREQRAQVFARAAALRDAGDPREVAYYFSETAAVLDDPVLAVEAAEARLSIPGPEGLREAQRDLEIARVLLAGVIDPSRDPGRDARLTRVSRSEVDTLSRRCDAIESAIAQGMQQLAAKARVEKRGRQELRAGAVLASLGGGGLLLLAGGLGVVRDRSEKLDQARQNETPADSGSLDAQRARGTTMIATGAVIAAVGLIVGSTLIGVGDRDMRSGRSRPGERVRVVPAVGGVVLMGSF